MAVAQVATHSQRRFPPRYQLVSSTLTTGAARTTAWMAASTGASAVLTRCKLVTTVPNPIGRSYTSASRSAIARQLR